MALNPFMVFYATESRPYTLAIALLLGSTLAMLIAAERRSARWWALYAVLVALAMYSHYTAAFVLGAQLLWLIWARPQARAPALIATGAAALLYLPWVPGVLADARSPTVDVLSALQGNGFSLKLNAIASWAFGYPYQSTDRIPGELPLAIGVVAVAFLGAAAGARLLRAVREHEVSVHSDLTESLALAAVMALAVPLAEVAILLAGGTDLFGARNLDLASGGFAVLLGGLAAVAGPRLGAVGIGALLAVFAVGTLKSVDSSYEFADYHAAAAFIDRSARQRDVVVDMESTLLSPVPTTSIEAQMTGDRPVYNLYQPTGPPPFLSGSPPPAPILKQALRRVGDGRLYVVAADGLVKETEGGVTITLPAATIFRSIGRRPPPRKVINLPGWRVAESGHWPGVLDVNVYALSPPEPLGPRARASP